MTVTVTESGAFERLVRFTITDEQINEAKKGAARKLAQEIKIHGFRPGKAPLPIIEATVGADRVRQEAIEDLLNPTLNDVLSDEDIEPAINPELESIDDVDGGVEVEVKVTLWPTIELPNYKGRKIEVTNPAVTPEDMETQTRRMLEQFATVEEVERPAEVGDFVSIDISATKDGEPIEEATAEELLYEVGSGLLIEGIDDQATGASAGDVLTFEGTLPAGFGDRAGESVEFTVTVHEVKERILPELDDEWVDENTEFETVEQLQAALETGLADAKLRAVSAEYSEKVLATLRDQVDIDLPEGLVRSEMDRHLHDFLHRLEEAELQLDDYFRASGITQEAFLADLRGQAELSLRNRLVLDAVIEAENIQIDEEELSAAIRSLAARAQDPVAFLDAFRRSGRELALASDILRNRALDAILSNADPVDEDGNPVDLSVKVQEVEAEIVDDDEVVTAEEEEE
ncbi:MAG TPA: trigger factor [Acidimicrobiia bacterium]|jgi:trigger factor|nr:trigger factor [Acidimicrobiia bacterium]